MVYALVMVCAARSNGGRLQLAIPLRYVCVRLHDTQYTTGARHTVTVTLDTRLAASC